MFACRLLQKSPNIKKLQQTTRNYLNLIAKNCEIQKFLTDLFSTTALPPTNQLPDSISHFDNNVNWIRIPEFVPDNIGLLLELLFRLRTIVFTSLMTTPEDEKRHKKYLKQLDLKDKKNRQKVDELTRQLDKINAKHEEEMINSGQKIEKLKNEIEVLENYLDERIRQVSANEQMCTKDLIKNHDVNKSNLQKKLKKLTETVKKTIETNYNDEKLLRSEYFKIETEIEAKIEKFDQEMCALQEEYDSLEGEYTEERKTFEDLEDKFQVLEEEYLAIMEERRIADEKRQREEEQKRRMELAVTTIQAFWRSYKVRKMVRSKRGKSRK